MVITKIVMFLSSLLSCKILGQVMEFEGHEELFQGLVSGSKPKVSDDIKTALSCAVLFDALREKSSQKG